MAEVIADANDDSGADARPIVPFRHRHDGWTRGRQKDFLLRLTETGCVTEACRAVGLSTRSAYRAYARMPDFADGWREALATRRPMLEDAAFERAINGVTVPLTRLGQVIGERRQYSDGLLRFMIEREDKHAKARGGSPHRKIATSAETDRVLTKRLDQLARMTRQKEKVEAIALADRMAAQGKAP